jgi:hypothetical protein
MPAAAIADAAAAATPLFFDAAQIFVFFLMLFAAAVFAFAYCRLLPPDAFAADTLTLSFITISPPMPFSAFTPFARLMMFLRRRDAAMPPGCHDADTPLLSPCHAADV